MRAQPTCWPFSPLSRLLRRHAAQTLLIVKSRPPPPRRFLLPDLPSHPAEVRAATSVATQGPRRKQSIRSSRWNEQEGLNLPLAILEWPVALCYSFPLYDGRAFATINKPLLCCLCCKLQLVSQVFANQKIKNCSGMTGANGPTPTCTQHLLGPLPPPPQTQWGRSSFMPEPVKAVHNTKLR